MTFGAIKSRIADELMRPDLASQIALAVNDAIKEAAGNRFWFNEVRGLALPLIAGQNFYTSTDLSALSKIDSLWIIASNQRREVCEVNALQIIAWQEGAQTLTGEPDCYARQADGLLFYMTPRLSYPAYIDGVTRFALLSADTDDNAYLTEGERYVRALAKANVLENVVRDYEAADRQWQVAEREKGVLLRQTSDRIGADRNMAWL